MYVFSGLFKHYNLCTQALVYRCNMVNNAFTSFIGNKSPLFYYRYHLFIFIDCQLLLSYCLNIHLWLGFLSFWYHSVRK